MSHATPISVAQAARNHSTPCRAPTRASGPAWPRRRASPVRARIAEALFRPRRALAAGPRGVPRTAQRIGAGGPTSPVMRIVRPDAFFRRLGASSKIGFGEAYMAGDWTSTAAGRPAHPVRGQAVHADPARPCSGCSGATCEARQPREEANTVDGLAGEHPPPLRPVQRAVRAVPRRDDDLLRRPGSTAPAATTSPTPSAARSTGCSTWPGSGRAARCWRSAPAGASWPSGPPSAAPACTTLTISAEQPRWPSSGCAEAGVADRVRCCCATTARPQGSYDAVVSVEMIEAVGVQYWPTYFAAAGPAAQARRPGRAAGDHHAARPDAGHPQHATPGSTSTSSRAG